MHGELQKGEVLLRFGKEEEYRSIQKVGQASCLYESYQEERYVSNPHACDGILFLGKEQKKFSLCLWLLLSLTYRSIK